MNSPAIRLAVGLGCDRDTPLATVEQAVDEALRLTDARWDEIAVFATIEAKRDELALLALAVAHARPLLFFGAQALAAVPVPNPSETVRRYMGTPSVSEAAALLAAHTGAHALLVEKHRLRGADGRHATVSIARIPHDIVLS